MPPRSSLFFLILASVALLGTPARGEVTEAARQAARALGYDGVEAYQHGDYATAAQKLGLAFEVVKVATVGLWSARALEKTGRLVEAYERYVEVIQLKATEGRIEAQVQAQAEAATEGAALLARIPTILIAINGAAANEVLVTVDDQHLPTNKLKTKYLLDPGTHVVVAKARSEVIRKEIELKEGQDERVELWFSGIGTVKALNDSAPAASAAPLPPVEAEPSPLPRSSPVRDELPPRGRTHHTLAWVALGVGGLGVVVGGVTGGMAMSKRESLDCADNVCAPEQQEEVDSYNTLCSVSTVGFATGAVGLAAGAALFVTAPRQSATTAALRAWVGVGSAGLAGTF